MVKLIDIHGVVDDEWTVFEADHQIASQTNLVVDLQQMHDNYDRLKAAKVEFGVKLAADQVVEDILYGLGELNLIVLSFESFADGRAFSQAKLLRDRYGYEGELRAVGEVIRDQLSFMQRCGFSQFEIDEGENILQALQSFSQITHVYQSDISSATLPG